jgi:hypothetical protein
MWGHLIGGLPCKCGGSGAFGARPPHSHERFGSISDPIINGHLHYPNDVDRSINEAAAQN